MSLYYSNEKNAQVVIALLKYHGIRNVIASPGTTNTAFVASIQNDPFFIIRSSVDERSAAYIACGLAAELGEPVVISCTGATASRNYLPGMTEAYYRKLPILAVTSMQDFSKVGHHVAQVLDRSVIQNDVAMLSVTLPIVKDSDDLWDCEIKVNKAILALKHRGGGPVHINLPTTYSKPYSTKELPPYRTIDRITTQDEFPKIWGRVAIFVGSHRPWSEADTKAVDDFCARNDSLVFCDHTSGYRGGYRVQYSLRAAQEMLDLSDDRPDILIHIGEISGDYASLRIGSKEVWRVSPDGEVRDTFRRLRFVFEMPESVFFRHYADSGSKPDCDYFNSCKVRLDDVRSKVPELPFSNIWAAARLAHLIPEGSAIHFGILNSLRAWNFYELPVSVTAFSNVGGFGIDGVLSALIGASFGNGEKLYFGVIGDLAFFYDMNVLGNRHVGPNVRILLVNNGKGTEFRQYNHHAAYFGEAADEFVAAAGHFGNKSTTLVKNYAENLGFEYFSAKNKEEFELVFERFVEPNLTERPMVFEVFTEGEDESKALQLIQNTLGNSRGRAKQLAKQVLGHGGISAVKRMLKK